MNKGFSFFLLKFPLHLRACVIIFVNYITHNERVSTVLFYLHPKRVIYSVNNTREVQFFMATYRKPVINII